MKKFLIIGNINACCYKNIFPSIKDNKMWMGVTYFNGGAAHFIAPSELYDPDKMYDKKNAFFNDKGEFIWRVNGVRWYTNLDHSKRRQPLELTQTYDPERYPRYDSYDAINVDKVVDIPKDYDGVMGVPISFLDKYCPEQFEIVGIANSARWIGDFPCFTIINGKKVYNRILIKSKNNIIKNILTNEHVCNGAQSANI